MVALALAVIAAFDLQPVTALDDDWGYLYSVRHLAAGDGLRWFPTDSALHLVQTLWATAVTLGRPDPRALRLSGLPFLGLAVAALYGTARSLGAAPFWSAVAAAALLTTPVAAAVEASFMSDVFYLGLLMAAVYLLVRWVDGRAPAWVFALVAVAASLQRLHGVMLAPLALLALLLVHRRRGARRSEVAAVAALGLAAVIVFELPNLIGAGGAQMRERAGALAALHPRQLIEPLLVLPDMLGWFATPFLLVLARRPPARRLWPLVVALVLLTALVTWWSVFEQGLWYVKWSGGGVGPGTMGGAKPHIARLFTYVRWYDLAMPPLLGVLLWQAAPRGLAALGGTSWLLLAASASQLVPMVQTGPVDRYFLVVAAPLLPVLALHATRLDPALASRLGALLLALANLGAWAVAEQDYLAWQAAAERVARSVYAQVPPLDVAAEYELNANYAAVPYYDRTGRYAETAPGRASLADLTVFLEFGPSDPRVRLCFAGRGDPRPGADYFSLAPGRIVYTQGGC